MKLRTAVAGAVVIAGAALVPTLPAAASPHHGPASCVTAIHDYEQIAQDAAQFATVASQYAAQIEPAAQAGINQDANAINDITAKITSLNGQVTAITARINAISPGLNRAKAACEAGR